MVVAVEVEGCYSLAVEEAGVVLLKSLAAAEEVRMEYLGLGVEVAPVLDSVEAAVALKSHDCLQMVEAHQICLPRVSHLQERVSLRVAAEVVGQDLWHSTKFAPY